MIELIKTFFSRMPDEEKQAGRQRPKDQIHLATCALFLELAHIDESFSRDEMALILSLLEKDYGLSSEHAEALIAEAKAELNQSVDLWQFAKLINEHYSPVEKIAIIETLWRLVFVDGRMDAHEDYLMHRLAGLLRLSHKDLMDAKVKVLRSK
jgi:uncharacterized tellurite resistance protein B-like protein